MKLLSFLRSWYASGTFGKSLLLAIVFGGVLFYGSHLIGFIDYSSLRWEDKSWNSLFTFNMFWRVAFIFLVWIAFCIWFAFSGQGKTDPKNVD